MRRNYPSTGIGTDTGTGISTGPGTGFDTGTFLVVGVRTQEVGLEDGVLLHRVRLNDHRTGIGPDIGVGTGIGTSFSGGWCSHSGGWIGGWGLSRLRCECDQPASCGDVFTPL